MDDHVIELQRKYFDFRKSLYRDGFLDDQFKQLQQLQDESNPGFFIGVINGFFENTERRMGELAETLSQLKEGFKKMDARINQLKGSSSSVGAQRVDKVCIAFRNCCEEKNIDRCLICLQQLQNEYSLVKEALEAMFELEKQVLAAGGSLPPPDMP